MNVCTYKNRTQKNLNLGRGLPASGTSKMQKEEYGNDRLCGAGMAEGAPGSPAGHVLLIHAAQKADAEDPWLHLEWGEILVLLGRPHDSGRHFQVCFLVFQSEMCQCLVPACYTCLSNYHFIR